MLDVPLYMYVALMYTNEFPSMVGFKIIKGFLLIRAYNTVQTSQLSRFGRETHDLNTNLTTAC